MRFPLYLQTLGMLVLYLSTLVAIVLLCFNAQFGIGWEAALKSPLGERFETVAGAVSSQLHATKPADWPEVIKAFESQYHVKFCVFDIAGNQVAGDPVSLPPAVSNRIILPPLPLPPHGGPVTLRLFDRRQLPPDGKPLTVTAIPDAQPAGRPIAGHEFPEPPPDGGPMQITAFPGPPPYPGPPPSSGSSSSPGLPPFSDHAFLLAHGGRPGMHLPMPPAVAFVRARDRFLLHTEDPDRFWICAHILVFSPRLGFHTPGVLVAICDNLWQSGLLIDLKMVVEFFAVVLVLSLVFWWPFIYRITSALSRLTMATERIAQGKFDTRVNTRGGDEIGRLSEAVDAMAGQLQGHALEQKRLLADISHELFTPLARQQLALELLDEVSTDEQRDHITDIREEVEEMNSLISELVAYCKAGMQAKAAELAPVDLRKVFSTLIPRLVNPKNITIDLPEEMIVMADTLLIARAISNVLRNSVRYAGPDGHINVSAVRDGDAVLLTIADNGPGVSETTLQHLGQPFYRPEASRNRASGGFGLGLAIVKSCVEACKGSVTLSNAETRGLVVTIKLKAAELGQARDGDRDKDKSKDLDKDKSKDRDRMVVL